MPVTIVVDVIADLGSWRNLALTYSPLAAHTSLSALAANPAISRIGCAAVALASQGAIFAHHIVDLAVTIVIYTIAKLSAW
jgi:hypothetical protein